jgi:hypothetical protein
MSHKNDDERILGKVLARAANSLRETAVSDEIIDRCRVRALSLDEQHSRRIHSPSNWICRWAVPASIAASLVLVMNIGQAIARLPPQDRQLAAIESLPDGRVQRVYSDGVIVPILNSDFHRSGNTR